MSGSDAAVQTDVMEPDRRELSYSVQTQTHVRVRSARVQVTPPSPQLAERAVQVGDHVTHGPEFPPGGLSFSDITDILAERPDAPISELVPILEERAPLAPLHLIHRRRLTGYVAMAISAETALLNQIARKATDHRETRMSGEGEGIVGSLGDRATGLGAVAGCRLGFDGSSPG